jgi:hypothetical protein
MSPCSLSSTPAAVAAPLLPPDGHDTTALLAMVREQLGVTVELDLACSPRTGWWPPVRAPNALRARGSSPPTPTTCPAPATLSSTSHEGATPALGPPGISCGVRTGTSGTTLMTGPR